MSSKTDPVRVTINIEVNPTIEHHEIDRTEWDAMTPAERRSYIDDLMDAAVQNAGGYGWHIDDPDDLAATDD